MRRLSRGSYESVISSLDAEIQEQAEALFGSKVETYLLGTFPGYALVAADDGRCLRVKYESALDGKMLLSIVERVAVPSYDEDDLDEFLQTEAVSVIDLYRQGSAETAEDRLRGLLALSGKWSGAGVGLAESWFSSISRSCPWLRLYEACETRIRRSLGSDIEILENRRLRPKFHRLYDGSSIREDLAGYRGLLTDDFGVLYERIDGLEKDIHSACASVRSLPIPKEDTMTTFTSFAEDLLEDLGRLGTIAKGAPTHVTQIGTLGRLYDLATERFSKMDVAGSFISRMASRLGEG